MGNEDYKGWVKARTTREWILCYSDHFGWPRVRWVSDNVFPNRFSNAWHVPVFMGPIKLFVHYQVWLDSIYEDASKPLKFDLMITSNPEVQLSSMTSCFDR